MDFSRSSKYLFTNCLAIAWKMILFCLLIREMLFVRDIAIKFNKDIFKMSYEILFHKCLLEIRIPAFFFKVYKNALNLTSGAHKKN